VGGTGVTVGDGVAGGAEVAVAEAEGVGFGGRVGVEVGAAVAVKVVVGVDVVGGAASSVLSARARETVGVTWLVSLTRAVGKIEVFDGS